MADPIFNGWYYQLLKTDKGPNRFVDDARLNRSRLITSHIDRRGTFILRREYANVFFVGKYSRFGFQENIKAVRI